MEQYKIEFAKELGFRKIKATKIKDIVFIGDTANGTYIPVDLDTFVKENLVEVECWWEDDGLLYFEDIDDLIYYFLEEWTEFCRNKNIKVEEVRKR